MPTIGQKLKYLLKKQRKTQKSLADAVNISPSRLSNYMHDKREPNLGLLDSMAAYFSVTLSYFSNDISNPQEFHRKDAENHNPRTLNVPLIHILGYKLTAPNTSIALDTLLLAGIKDPVVIDIRNESHHLLQGSYLLTSKIDKHEIDGTLIIKTGRHSKLYYSSTYKDQRILINIEDKTCTALMDETNLYAVKMRFY